MYFFVFSRDGLGRFQVYFIEDQIVKELPEASIIPVAELVNGTQVFFRLSICNSKF